MRIGVKDVAFLWLPKITEALFEEVALYVEKA